MKVVVICDDVVINSGVVNIMEKTVYDASNGGDNGNRDLGFDFYFSYSDYAKSSDTTDDILLFFYYLRVNSIDTSMFIKALDESIFKHPVLIYSAERLNDDYVSYLLENGVNYVLIPSMKENEISSIFNDIFKSYKEHKINKQENNYIRNNSKQGSHFHSLDLYATYTYKCDPRFGLINTDVLDHSVWLDEQKKGCIADSKEKSLITTNFNKLNISLSIRKQKLIQGLVLGLSNKELAERSNLSLGTVRNYIHQLTNHFEVSNRTELALKLKEILSL